MGLTHLSYMFGHYLFSCLVSLVLVLLYLLPAFYMCFYEDLLFSKVLLSFILFTLASVS